MKLFPIFLRVSYLILVLLAIHLGVLGTVQWGGGANTTTRAVGATIAFVLLFATYVLDVLFARYIIYRSDSLGQTLIIYVFGYLNIQYVQATVLYVIALLGGWGSISASVVNDPFNCFYTTMLPTTITTFNTVGLLNAIPLDAASSLWIAWISITGIMYISFLLSTIASRVGELRTTAAVEMSLLKKQFREK